MINNKVSASEWMLAKRKLTAAKDAIRELEKFTFVKDSKQALLAISNLSDVCETLIRAME